MYQLHLNKADQAIYLASLHTHHRVRVRVRLLTLDHVFVADVSDRFLAGQVDVDATAEVDRRCSLTLHDADGGLGLDTGNANDGAVFADRLVQVHYGISSERLGRWVDVPVFTGPVTGLARDGSKLELQAQGKEFFMVRPAWRVTSVKKGTTKTAAIRSLLRQAGERFMDIPEVPGAKLTSNLQVPRDAKAWLTVQQLARSLGGRVQYDGRGYATWVPLRQATSYVFRGGQGGNLLSVPSLSYDISEVCNAVTVQGGVPKGKKAPLNITEHAPASHPLSRQRLARGGVHTILGKLVEAPRVTTEAEARKLAKAELNKALRQGMDVEFTAMPNPLLEPLDNVQVRTASYTFNFQADKYTLPLSGDGGMTLGKHYLARGVRR